MWLLGPLLVGVAAGNGLNTDLVWLTVAALPAFSLRQPLTIAVMMLAGRRTRAQLSLALLWSAIYTVVVALSVALLLRSGHSRILWLAAVGAPVFAWHLWLVSRRSEPEQPGVEIVASGVLALAAPVAYRVAGGSANWLGRTMWFLQWLQSAASIVQVHYRLSLGRPPSDGDEPGVSPGRAPAYLTVSAGASAAAVLFGLAPAAAPLAFSIPLLDGILSIARPDPGALARSIGIRQLMVSSAFMLLMAVGYAGFSRRI